MVRPVPSSLSASVADTGMRSGSRENAQDAVVIEDDMNQAGHSLGDDELRRRFGPGFELRSVSRESGSAAEGSPPVPPFDQDGAAEGSPPVPPFDQDGAALYRGFLDDEFRRRNLPNPAQLFDEESFYHRASQPSSSDVIQAGGHLRLLSEEFSRSPLRRQVELQAARVPLEQLDFNAFSELLYGLFQEGGVTSERVVVLFYFCADLAARAFREQLPRQFQNIIEWSFKFFTGATMLRWVTENGGWVQIMQSASTHFYKLATLSFLVLGVVSFGVYLWRSR